MMSSEPIPESLTRVTQQFLTISGLGDAVAEVGLSDQTSWSFSPRLSDLSSASRFPIFSITKSFIACLALLGEEEGHFQLEEPMALARIGELPSWLAGVTLWDLLCHRSGLGDYGYLKKYKQALQAHPDRPLSAQELRLMVFELGSQKEAHGPFFYSNVGYLLLVEFLEKHYAKTLDQLVQEKITSVLGMEQTGFLHTVADMKGMLPGFSSLWHGKRDVREIYHPDWVSHRLLASTTTDLNRFMRAIFSGELLGPQSLTKIKTPYRLPFPHAWLQPSYGPGFMGDVDSKFGLVLGHNGGGPGYSTASYARQNKRGELVTVAVMVPQDDSEYGENLALTLLQEISRRDL